MINDTKSLKSYSENIETVTYKRQTIQIDCQFKDTEWQYHKEDTDRLTESHRWQTGIQSRQIVTQTDIQTDNITQTTNRQTISHRWQTDIQSRQIVTQTEIQYHTHRQTDRQYHTQNPMYHN